MTGKDLSSRLEEVRELCKEHGADNIPIGFADSWNMMIEGEAVPVIQASDIVYARPPIKKLLIPKRICTLPQLCGIELFTDNALSFSAGLQMHSVTGRGKRLLILRTCSLIIL